MDDAVVSGWDSDQICWASGYSMLVSLRSLRFGWRGTPPQPREAEQAIKNYCQRLRASDQSLPLPRTQREYRVPDHGIVLVVFATASYFGMPLHTCKVHDAAILSVGFCPRKLIEVRSAIDRQCGFYRLLQRYDSHLGVSEEFYDFLRGEPLDDWHVRRMKRKIEALPTSLKTKRGKQE